MMSYAELLPSSSKCRIWNSFFALTNMLPEVNNRKPFQRYLECIIGTIFFPERAISGAFYVFG